jgi:hypothetical protein
MGPDPKEFVHTPSPRPAASFFAYVVDWCSDDVIRATEMTERCSGVGEVRSGARRLWPTFLFAGRTLFGPNPAITVPMILAST